MMGLYVGVASVVVWVINFFLFIMSLTNKLQVNIAYYYLSWMIWAIKL